MSIKDLALFAFICAIQPATASLTSDLNATAALDLSLPLLNERGTDEGFQVIPRSAELMFHGPVDHLFDGMVSFGGHTEEGEFFFELHEGYVSSSKLFEGSQFKLGKFFLGLGRLNQVHQHDWPFADVPVSHEEFFADEGVSDTGVEYSYLLPTDHFVQLTAGLTSSYCYGHCHDAGNKPNRPLVYIHPTTYFEISDESGLQLGLSYLNREDESSVQTQLFGFDVVLKKRTGKLLRWLVQAEAYFEDTQSPVEDSTGQKIGGYLYAQHGINNEHFVGLRFDAFSDLDQKFLTNNNVQKNLIAGLTSVYTWKPSEFASVRFSAGLHNYFRQSEKTVQDVVSNLQFVYILGSHPAHDF